MSEQQVNNADYVLFLCSWYPSRVDAFNGDFVQRHARAVATHCKVVVLYARKDSGIKKQQTELHYQFIEGVHEYIYYYPQRQFLDKLWSQWYYRQACQHFIERLFKEHGIPKLVHVNVLWKSAQWALYLYKKFKWPFVITEHSTEYLPNGADNFRKKEQLRKKITRKAFEKSVMLMPVSLRLGEAMQGLFGDKRMMVIPNVVDTKLFFPVEIAREQNIPFRLVHVSTMGFQKNIDGIVRVAKRLVEAGHNLLLEMIGPASEEIISKLSSNELLRSKIHFTGPISYEQVAAHLRQADGFFLFSRYENLPCVILEALCCGVPVISTDVGDINTVIDESNGKLILSEDEEALYQSLVHLIKGERKYDKQEIAQKAREKFSYSTVSQHYEEAYKTALGLIQPNL